MIASALQPSDTWILVALLHATEPGAQASLIELIRAADVVNHAIITRGELEAGFNRLVTAGHAIASPDSYAPSVAVREFWNKRTESWGALYKSWEKLGRHVGAEAMPACPLPKIDAERYVSKIAYEAAIASYSVNVPHSFFVKK